MTAVVINCALRKGSAQRGCMSHHCMCDSLVGFSNVGQLPKSARRRHPLVSPNGPAPDGPANRRDHRVGTLIYHLTV
jgi:hypothetical protein